MSTQTFPKKIEVVGYSGYKTNERPLSFVLDERELKVSDVLERWYGIEHDYFKVVAEDDRIYLLKWHRIRDLWFVVKVFGWEGMH